MRFLYNVWNLRSFWFQSSYAFWYWNNPWQSKMLNRKETNGVFLIHVFHVAYQSPFSIYCLIMVSANEKRRYISNVLSHWLRPFSCPQSQPVTNDVKCVTPYLTGWYTRPETVDSKRSQMCSILSLTKTQQQSRLNKQQPWTSCHHISSADRTMIIFARGNKHVHK